MANDTPLEKVRNLGIMAHIDAGKTTVTERILFYTWRTHKIWETHDGESQMDWMDQEKERWITITSATTVCFWKGHHINIIDTPGHVDFTIEVERSLRVLDGAVALLDWQAWVEPQTETVWRQADKYGVPRMIFVNKMDKMGANFYASVDSIKNRLTEKAIPIEIPNWASDTFAWVVNLVNMKYYTFEWEKWVEVVEWEIPAELQAQAEEYREALIDRVSVYDDEIAEKFLEWEEISEELLKKAIRTWTCSWDLFPIMCGSALGNKWVQLMIDAVCDYLPSPLDRWEIVWEDPDHADKKLTRKADINQPASAIAFKIMTDPFVGTLTYVRVYSWVIKSWDTLLNPVTGQKERVWRLLMMHANKREEITEISAWHICAFLWLKDTRTWNTLCDLKNPIVLENMTFPEPVISIAVEPKSKWDQEKMWLALSKLSYEDPTFRYRSDEESGQTIISWMGELHLEVLIERMKREHKVEVNTWAPQVAYRETIMADKVEWVGIFKRQTWWRGQYWHVELRLEKIADKNYEFVSEIKWWVIPNEFIPAIDKWAKETMAQWILAWYPIINLRVVPFFGSYHDVDSSEVSFKIATYRAFREAFMKPEAQACILEPIMSVEVVTPEEYVGTVLWDISSRRGLILWQAPRWNATVIEAKVPLSEMFGYSTDLRSNTQWRAQYTMQMSHYEKVPENISRQIIEERSGKIKAMDAE